MIKNLPANAGDTRDAGLIPGSGRSLGVGNGNQLQYSCPGKFHQQWRLVGYSPWSHKESDTTEHAHANTHTQAYLTSGYKHNTQNMPGCDNPCYLSLCYIW